MEKIYSYKDFSTATAIKDVDGKKGIVTGYFADFNTLDSDGDVIKSGAFVKTLQLNGVKSQKPRIKHLLNHNPSQPLGVLTELKEDNKGLYYESKIGNHNLGMDFIKMVESDLIKEHSIGYQVKKFNQVTSWEDYKDGDVRRELTELKLWEGSSLTAWGANPNTPLTGLKGHLLNYNEIEINKLVNQHEAIEDFCRNSKATDETIEQLLTYNKQLLKIITESRSGIPTSSQEHSESNEEKKDDKQNDATQEVSIMRATVECPKCKRHTYDTLKEKGYVKCHRPECETVFVGGLFVTI